MTAGTDRLKDAWRDSVTAGVPATGPNEPDKGEIRAGFDALALDIVAAGAGGDPNAVRAVIEPIRDDALAAAGFPIRSDAITFAPKMSTGEVTSVRETDAGTHAAVAGEVRLDGTAATVGELIPNEGYYTKQASGALWRTASSERQSAAIQAGLAAASAAALSTSRQFVGRPAGSTPSAGTGILGTNTYVQNSPIVKRQRASFILLTGAAAGAISVEPHVRSGTTNTRQRMQVYPVVAGAQIIDARLYPDLLAQPGELIGVRGSGIIPFTASVSPDGGGYYSGAPDPTTGAFSQTNPTTTSRLEITIIWEDFEEGSFLRTDLDDLANQGSKKVIAGRNGPLMAGTAVTSRTWVLDTPSTKYRIYTHLGAWGGVAGQWKARKYSKTGDVFQQLSQGGGRSEVTATLGTGVQEGRLSVPMMMAPGERPGVFPPPGALHAVTTQENAFFGYYDSGTNTGDVGSFTDAAVAIGSTTLQMYFRGFEFDLETWTGSLTSTLLSGTTSSGDSFAGVIPTSYHALSLLGQSNGAGRGPTVSPIVFETSQAWKYVRSATVLQLCADPTGNDSTAISGNRGSLGPAFARAIMRRSSGRTGAIIVNSCEGATSTTGWVTAGANWTQAVTDWNNAMTDAAAKSLPIDGCTCVITLGETDAAAGMAKATYKANMLTLIGNVRGLMGSKVPILIIRLGTKNTGDTASYQAIRAAQHELAAENAGVYLVHTGALYYAAAGKMIDADHYTTAAYDEIGDTVGNAAFPIGAGIRPLGYTG